jgi:thiamine-phosphate pyrophosphorylase
VTKRLDLSLYGIIGPENTRGRDPALLVHAAAAGGMTLLQLRDKRGEARGMIATAQALKGALAGTGVPLLVNDRVDVAVAAEADGVHLGQSDIPPEIARRMLGDEAIVGLTVRDEAEARQAPVGMLDYICIGGVFATSSKVNETPPLGVEGLRRLVAILRARAPGLPLAAIAGVDAANAGAVIRAGVEGVAVISALFGAEDVEGAARALRAAVERGRGEAP